MLVNTCAVAGPTAEQAGAGGGWAELKRQQASPGTLLQVVRRVQLAQRLGPNAASSACPKVDLVIGPLRLPRPSRAEFARACCWVTAAAERRLQELGQL